MTTGAVAVNHPPAGGTRGTLTGLRAGSSMCVMIRTAAYRYYYYFATPLPGRWSRTR